jgi:hypothetical protein
MDIDVNHSTAFASIIHTIHYAHIVACWEVKDEIKEEVKEELDEDEELYDSSKVKLGSELAVGSACFRLPDCYHLLVKPFHVLLRIARISRAARRGPRSRRSARRRSSRTSDPKHNLSRKLSNAACMMYSRV